MQLPPYSLTILLINMVAEDFPQGPASLALLQPANYSGQLFPLTFVPVPPPPPPTEHQQPSPAATQAQPAQASCPAPAVL